MNERMMKREPNNIIVHNTVISNKLNDARHIAILLDVTKQRHGNLFGGPYHKGVLPSAAIKNFVPIPHYAPHIDFNDGDTFWNNETKEYELAPVTNDNSIGIAVSFDGSKEQMTERQFAVTVNEIAWMRLHYKIPNVYKHSQINRTSCPGALFPWDRMMEAIDTTIIKIENAKKPVAPIIERVYADVETGRWSEEVIRWCKDHSIMNGDEYNLFRPLEDLSREEAAAMARNIVIYIMSYVRELMKGFTK